MAKCKTAGERHNTDFDKIHSRQTNDQGVKKTKNSNNIEQKVVILPWLQSCKCVTATWLVWVIECDVTSW